MGGTHSPLAAVARAKRSAGTSTVSFLRYFAMLAFLPGKELVTKALSIPYEAPYAYYGMHGWSLVVFERCDERLIRVSPRLCRWLRTDTGFYCAYTDAKWGAPGTSIGT